MSRSRVYAVIRPKMINYAADIGKLDEAVYKLSEEAFYIDQAADLFNPDELSESFAVEDDGSY